MRSVRTSPPRGPGRAQMLALATVAGLAAALLAYFGLARQTQGAARPTEHSTAVVVAARALPARQPLTPALLRVEEWPVSRAPVGAVPMPTDLTGQVTTAAIGAGQPVTRDRVTPPGAAPGMAGSVAPGHRAVGVALSPESGVTGFLEPGDHVDVLATLDGSGGPAATRGIVQNARLLALGTRTAPTPPDSSDDKPATSATLEVTPSQAQALALAAARGKLQLALRGFGDTTPAAETDVPGPTPASAEKPPARRLPATRPPKAPAVTETPRKAPAPPAPPEAPAPITVIRGTQTTTVTLGD